MKKALATLAVLMSGGYLLTLGILPDPVPFIDEGIALVVLVKSLGYLGIDISRFVPFMSRKVKPGKGTEGDGQTIDV
ncbi:MAG: hypothetical protein CFE26_02965 [Verrucomicrobiales bacterium VVV1]|nr:MAG: hypothetical protein CFE26_02965 [Verrucomicrobiales bacterium VVV1]